MRREAAVSTGETTPDEKIFSTMATKDDARDDDAGGTLIRATTP